MSASPVVKSMDWTSLDAGSRVWVYQADRALTDQEAEHALKLGKNFVRQWASHGNELHADFAVFHNRFVVLFVDEAKAPASGCSIDSSVHFVQGLGAELAVDFFDRMTICYWGEEEIRAIKLTDVPAFVKSGALRAETLVFDNLVSDLQAFQDRWRVNMSETWLSRFLT